MNEKNISKNILEAIKSVGIKPKPKWQFLIKDWVIWIFFAITIFIGSLATSIIIYMVKNNDWDLYGRLGYLFFFRTLPYFWIIILVIFVFLAYYNFKHTKGGYRHKFYIILLAAIIISFLLGTLFYFSGFGRKIETRMQKSLPLYHKMFIKRMSEHRRQELLQPDKGILAGTVIIDDRIDNFELEDFSGKVWTVLFSEALIHGLRQIELGAELMIVGQKIDESTFRAERIRPWFSPDMMHYRPMMKEKILF